MDKIFNFAIPELDADFLIPSFEKIRKGNLLRVYLKELVINKITEQISIERDQLEDAKNITHERLTIWQRYHNLIAPLEAKGVLRRPIIPGDCEHNAHMYYVILAPEVDRQHVLSELKKSNIFSVFHYVPLHSSPAGQRYGRASGQLAITNQQSERLIRLPLWVGLTEEQQVHIVNILSSALG